MATSEKFTRHPDTPDYPDIDYDVRVCMDYNLRYFLAVAENTYKRLRKIPRHDRPDWYDSNVRYWKNVAAGFRWAVKRNEQSMIKNAPESECSTNTTV